jgi:hypothetical protein
MHRDVLEVVFHDAWQIALQGREFGPYASEEEAILTARRWAANAEKQGHQVSIVVRGSGGDRGGLRLFS